MDVKSVSEVRVAFKKTVSDRQYGNETAEIALTAAISGEQDASQVAAALAVEARALVTAQLRASPSEQVQHALETREEREAREAVEREERERRWAGQRAAARQERFAGAVDDDSEDDDSEDDDSEDDDSEDDDELNKLWPADGQVEQLPKGEA